MPYYGRRKRYRGTPYRRRSRPQKPKLYRIADTAYKAYNLAKEIRGHINTEYKYADTEVNADAVDNAGTIRYLNLVAVGDTSETRDGAQYRNKSLEFRMRTHMSQSATASYIRVILGIDRVANNSGLSVAEVLQEVDPLSARNLDSRHRVVILKDWLFKLDITSNQSHVEEYYTKLDLKTVMSGSGGATGDLESGGIFVLYISNEATNDPDMWFHSRVRFIDN